MDEKNIGTVSLEGYEAVRKEAFEGPDTWICFDPSNGGRILFSESCIRFLRKPPYRSSPNDGQYAQERSGSDLRRHRVACAAL